MYLSKLAENSCFRAKKQFNFDYFLGVAIDLNKKMFFAKGIEWKLSHGCESPDLSAVEIEIAAVKNAVGKEGRKRNFGCENVTKAWSTSLWKLISDQIISF